jgi:hypothetical protein
MEVSGQLHIQAALTTGKVPPVPAVQEGGWTAERFELRGEEKNLTPAGNRTPAVKPVARPYTDSKYTTYQLQRLISSCCLET